MYRDELKSMIKEPDKKIMPKSWKRELEKLEPEFKATQKPYSQVVWKLAAIEVLNHNITGKTLSGCWKMKGIRMSVRHPMLRSVKMHWNSVKS